MASSDTRDLYRTESSIEESEMEDIVLRIPERNDEGRINSAPPPRTRTSMMMKMAILKVTAATPRQRLARAGTHVLHNAGAAGDIEQHVDVDEKNKPVMKADVRVQKTSNVTEVEVKARRTKLKKMFNTPCRKWKDRGKFPFKLTLQLLKVLIVTIQLTTFFGERSTFDEFRKTNTDTFRKIFLKGDLDEESNEGVIFTPKGLYDHMNHVIYQYYRYDELSMSNRLHRNKSAAMEMDITYFKKLHYDVSRRKYIIDPREDDDNTYMIPDIKRPNCTEADLFDCYDIEGYLSRTNQSIELSRLIEFDLVIFLGGIYVKVIDDSLEQPIDDVECVDFKIAINYDNEHSGGQLKVSLSTLLDVVKCQPDANVNSAAKTHNKISRYALTGFDVFVIAVCLVSGILAIRTSVRRYQQLKITEHLFNEHYGYKLTMSEYFDFVSLWYFFIVMSDILVITASSLKLYIRYGAIKQAKTFDNEQFYDATGIMFGVACISEWISLIRYLGYASQYYMLILTISNAIPDLLRFTTCALVIFFGYSLAGHVALGPYDAKYSTFSGSMQNLFALIHGDDLYATMNAIKYEENQLTIWATGQVYHYSYCILFIFAIANLSIAIIIDSYETVKDWKENGMPKSFLHHFTDGTLNEVDDEDPEPQFVEHSRDKDGCMSLLYPFLCCFHCKRKLVDEDGEEMVTVPHNGRLTS